ncbi:DNA-binding protein rif1 [Chamberlinius hualienensis]
MDQYSATLHNLSDKDTVIQHNGMIALEKLFIDPTLSSEWKTFTREKWTDLLDKLCKCISTTADEKTCCRGVTCLMKIVRLTDLTNDQIKLCLNAVQTIVKDYRNFSDAVEFEAVRAIESFLNCFPSATESMSSQWFELIFLRTVHSSPNIRHLAMHIFLERKSFLQQEIELLVSFIPQLKSVIVPKMKDLLNEDTSIEVLKLWGGIVHVLGDLLHRGASLINCLLEVMEKAFRSNSEEVLQGACVAWKELVNNFSSNTTLITNYKRLELLLRPFIEIIRIESEDVIHAKILTWWHLADRLGPHLQSNFNLVLRPLFDHCFGKYSPSYFNLKNFHSMNLHKDGLDAVLISYGVQFVGRLCESEKNNPGGASACFILNPLKRHAPGDSSLFVTQSKLMAFAAMRMASVDLPQEAKLIAFIWRCFTNCVKTKGDTILFRDYFHAVEVIFKTDEIKSLLLFEIIEMASLLPSNILFPPDNFLSGDRINATAASMLLENLLGKHVDDFSENKRFVNVFKQLTNYSAATTLNVQNSCREALQLLEKASCSIKSSDTSCKMWQLLTNQLIAAVEQTQDINQGDNLQHDFTCVQTALLYPFKHLYQWQSLSLTVRKSVWRIWDRLFDICVKCAAIIPKLDYNMFIIEFGVKLKLTYASCRHLLLEIVETYILTIIKLLEHISWKFDDISGSSEFSPKSTLDQYSPMTWNKKKTKQLYIVAPMLSLSSHLAEALIKFDESSVDKKEKLSAENKRYSTGVATSLLHCFEKLSNNLKGTDIIQVFVDLTQPLTKVFELSSTESSLFSEPKVVAKLEHVWSNITLAVATNYNGLYNTAMLNILSPLLEVTFKHNRRMINSATWTFWHSTFSACYGKLVIPDHLKKLMEEIKPKLFTADVDTNVNDNACNGSPQFQLTGDLLEDSAAESPNPLKGSFLQRKNLEDSAAESPNPLKSGFLQRKNLEQIAKTFSPDRTSMATPKARKSFKSSSLEQLSSSDFVVIETSPVKNIILTPHQKDMTRMKRFDIPAMYNDLTPDSNDIPESQTIVDETPVSAACSADSLELQPSTISAGHSLNKESASVSCTNMSDTNGNQNNKTNNELVTMGQIAISASTESESQTVVNNSEINDNLPNISDSEVNAINDSQTKLGFPSPLVNSDKLQNILNENVIEDIQNIELNSAENSISGAHDSSPKQLCSPLSPRSCSVVLKNMSSRELCKLNVADLSPLRTRNKRRLTESEVLAKMKSKKRKVSRNIAVNSPEFAATCESDESVCDNDVLATRIDEISELKSESIGEVSVLTEVTVLTSINAIEKTDEADMETENSTYVSTTENVQNVEANGVDAVQPCCKDSAQTNPNVSILMDDAPLSEIDSSLSVVESCLNSTEKSLYGSPNGILKKYSDGENSNVSTPSDKFQRRVSFADPPVSGELIVPVPESRTFRNRTASKPNKKFFRISSLNSGYLASKRDSFYQASEPIYDPLINCTLPVSQLLPYIVDSTQIRGFEKLLDSKAIHTVGDFSKLTKVKILGLPIQTPKVLNVHKGLKKFEMSLGVNNLVVNRHSQQNVKSENIDYCSNNNNNNNNLANINDAASEVNKNAGVSVSNISDGHKTVEVTDIFNENYKAIQMDLSSKDSETLTSQQAQLSESFSQNLNVESSENECQTSALLQQQDKGIQSVASTKESHSQTAMLPDSVNRNTQTDKSRKANKGIQAFTSMKTIGMQTEIPKAIESSTQTLTEIDLERENPLEFMFKNFLNELGQVTDVQMKQLGFEHIRKIHESVFNLMNVIDEKWCSAKQSFLT